MIFGAWSGGLPGGIVVSVYLVTGTELDADNAAILHLVGGALAEYGRPFVSGRGLHYDAG